MDSFVVKPGLSWEPYPGGSVLCLGAVVDVVVGAYSLASGRSQGFEREIIPGLFVRISLPMMDLIRARYGVETELLRLTMEDCLEDMLGQGEEHAV